MSERATAEPNMAELREEWNWCVAGRGDGLADRIQRARMTRAAEWPGKTPDGRRWYTQGEEEEVFPWPGAADTAVPLVDLYTRGDVALLMTIWQRNKIAVEGTEIADAAWSKRMTDFMRWMRYTQMKEYRREAKYLANFFLERGAGIMGVWWVRQKQMGYQTIELSDLAQLEAQAQVAVSRQLPPLHDGLNNQDLAELTYLVNDPTQEAAAVEIAQVLFPDAKPKALKVALRELRESGTTRIARPYTKLDRAKVCALALGEDIFLPPETSAIDDSCPCIHMRELITETTLMERVNTHGWDEAWVDLVAKTQKGNVTAGLLGMGKTRIGTGDRVVLDETGQRRLYEVIHTYRRQFNEDGVPAIYYTVWNQGTAVDRNADKVDGYAYHDILDYDHGEYPFTLVQREARTKLVEDSRGYSEIANTWQQALKAEFDAGRDRNSIALLPPSYHPTSKPPQAWGPGVAIGTGTPEKYGFFKGPGWDPGSQEAVRRVMEFADRYFGRPVGGGINKLESQWLNQELADDWMAGFASIDTQILKLSQQYVSDEFYYRIVGSEKPKPIRATREDIQGQFDLRISYNVLDLDSDAVKEKISLMTETVKLDQQNEADRHAMMVVIYDLLDPNLGERVMRSPEDSLAAEIKDEGDAYTQMFAGLPAPDVKEGVNAQARLQWLVSMLSSNPSAQQKLAQDPAFKAQLQKRIKQLQFQYQQTVVNPQIGRTGA